MSVTIPAQPDPSRIVRTPMKLTGIGRACYSPDADAGDGAQPAAPPKPKSDDAKPDTVTLTKDELKAQIAAALEAERKAAADKAAKDKAAADEAAAKEKGEWEKIAKANEEKAANLERSNRSLRVSMALRDHLAAAHPDYLNSVVDILPHIATDVDGDAIGKAVEKAASEFVARNPREKKGGSAAPPAGRAGSRVPMNRAPQTYRPPSPGVAGSRF